MLTIKSSPKNKEHFLRLKEFGKEIIQICQQLKINPILYGSLAYFIYTKDTKMNVNDIDLYVPEASFEKVIKVLKKKKINYNLTDWHSLQILKDDLKIELDAVDYWYKGPTNFLDFNFDDLKIKILSLEGLMHIYNIASKDSDTPKVYLKKYNTLKKFNAFKKLKSLKK